MKHLANKTYLYYIWLMVIGCLLLGISATLACSFYTLRERDDSLIDSAVKVSKIAINSTDQNGKFNQQEFHYNLNNYKEYADQDFIITGPNLRIYAVSDDININLDDSGRMFLQGIDISSVSVDAVNEYINAKISGYENRQYMISYPVTIDEMTLIIFTCMPMSTVLISIIKVVGAIWLLIAVLLLLGTSMIFKANNNNLLQIKQMNEIADAMANGDFDKRIAVSGDDEMSALAANFNKMAESLSKRDTFKNEYISNISHDIRSPLTTIKGFITAILDGTIPPEKTNKYLEIVYNEADRLNKLGNSLLELSRLDMMKDALQTESFDIVSFLIDCIEAMEDKYLRKNIALNLSYDKQPIYIIADNEKMQRICYNLIDNAIKYTNENGSINVSVTLNNDKALISVKDTGIGISENDLPHIFERLYKADKSRGQKKDSVGLGLAIVKELIEAHGEQITVVSKLGEGTNFSFEMPLDKNRI